MKISEQWLREWVNPDLSSEALGHQLTMAGLEVDAIDAIPPAPEKVVVGKVLELNPHPNADKLRICSVDIGSDEPISIVCGASNVVVGGLYPVATIGAVLPGNFKIKQSKLRGEPSFGMLCSASELGLETQSEGLYPLDDNAQPGTPIADIICFTDHVIDVDLTPNRADCFSIRGVAREVAAANSLEFTAPVIAAVAAGSDAAVNISLQAGGAAPLFAARVVKGINSLARTPVWLRERLRRAGMRPVHPVVDVTNYVMLELGQPMHGYDLNKLQGDLAVRFATAGEKLQVLGGDELTLTDTDLVISDTAGAVAFAGVIGGERTAVNSSTVDVLFEAAFFAPDALAGKARGYGLHTDSSLRFERGVDFSNTEAALERATALLVDIAGGMPGPVVLERLEAELPKRPAVLLRRAKLDSLLGISVPDADVLRMFAALGMQIATIKDGWQITPPGARFDIRIEEDLIEEVVRLYGYDQIPDIAGSMPLQLATSTETRVSVDRLRAGLVDQGYQEAITYSFIDPEMDALFAGDDKHIELQNPISSNQSVMRRSLWPGLIQALKLNLNRQENRVRLFEHGVKFSGQGDALQEQDVFAGVVSGTYMQEHWEGNSAGLDIFDIKSDVYSLMILTGKGHEFHFVTAESPVLRPGRSGRIERNGVPIGWIGELHPRMVAELDLDSAPLLFEFLVEPAIARAPASFEPISKFPRVRRDIAVLVDQELPVQDILAEVVRAAGALLREVVVFDIYLGESIDSGLKSVALGLILQDKSRTLTDNEVEASVSAVTTALTGKFNAKIRE
jgi:phenylalanyl-tRNA synthetase beta chain